MDTQAPARIPLVCTIEIAKALYNELSVGGLAPVSFDLADAACRWQVNRIVEHLKVQLAARQAEFKAPDAHPDALLATAQSYLRGRLEGQIDLLESLINDLAPEVLKTMNEAEAKSAREREFRGQEGKRVKMYLKRDGLVEGTFRGISQGMVLVDLAGDHGVPYALETIIWVRFRG